MTRKQRRLTLIGTSLGVLGLAVGLMLFAFREGIRFFNSPTDVVEKRIAPGIPFRLGGLIKSGSVVRPDNLTVQFEVTDGNKAIAVVANSASLPDLFKEGQGVVVLGALDGSGLFKADSVLAKHDETYMPKEVADALKKQGHWKDDSGKRTGAAAAEGAQ